MTKTEVIAEAKTFFDDEVAKLPQLNDNNFRHQLGKTPLWKKAIIKKIKLGNTVIVPIKYRQDIFLKQEDGEQIMELDKTSYLMIYKDGKQNMQAEWVTLIPNKELRTNKFVGIVNIEQWNGKFKRAFAINEGREIIPVYLNNVVSYTKANYNRQVTCITTRYYQISYLLNDDGIYIRLNEATLTHSETYCTVNGEGPGGYGGGGGSINPNTEEEPIVDEYITTFIDCNKDVNGTAVNSSCGCIGGNTGISACLEIVKDSLNSKFPCATKLVIDELQKIQKYKQLVEPFLQKGIKPNLTWNASIQPWTNGIYSGGTTQISSGSISGMSSDINLNSAILQNSSQLLIAATSIHETYHAYINYMFANNVNVTLFDKSSPSFMAGLYQYIIYEKTGSSNNYVDHYNMLTSQFDNMVDILQIYGNGAFSIDDCRKAMLFGMNNAGPNPDFGQAQFINQAYTDLLARFGFTPTSINTFLLNEINAPSNKKLPTSGCN